MKMTQVKVRNMQSPNGNDIPNQFIIEVDQVGMYFQSYDSIIALKSWTKGNRNVYLDKNTWDYSTTTGKYRNIFLGEGIAETRKKIASGEYKLANLN